MQSKKVILVATITTLFMVSLAGVLVVGGKWAQRSIKEEEATKQDTGNKQSQQVPEDQVVWYEIPELNIKFRVEKDIAENIGYRDDYAENEKFGYQLYAKRYPKYPEINQRQVRENYNSFSAILSYDLKDEYLSKCPADPKSSHMLLRTKDRIVCYIDDSFSQEVNKREGIYQKFDEPTKKLFDGYLKNVPVKEIK